MVGVGADAVTASNSAPQASPPTLTPAERLVEMVNTPEQALKVVQYEVDRKQLFAEKRDLLAPHEVDGDTLVASNTLKLESLKGLNLRGREASEMYVVDRDGKKVKLAVFIELLSNDPEQLKTALQGMVYNDETKFIDDERKNEIVHNILNDDKISSQYNGDGSDLTEMKDLIEPATTRFAAFLAPLGSDISRVEQVAEGGLTGKHTDRFVGGDVSADVGAVLVSTSLPESQSDVDGAVSGSGSEPVSDGDSSASQGQAEISKTLQKIENWGDEEQQLQEFKRLSAKKRLELIEELVRTASGEETEVSLIKKAGETAITLVKGWMGQEIVSGGFIVEAVENTSSGAQRDNEEQEGGGGEKAESQHSLQEETSSEFGIILNIDKDLSNLKTVYESSLSKIESLDGQLDNNGMFVAKTSDDHLVILPQLSALREGEIDSNLLREFYDIRPGEIDPGWGISQLSEVELNIDEPESIKVKTKGTLYLPKNHEYLVGQNLEE